jgi:1-acyl-sn-glycerol-3-phosphate acyltransferase
VDEDAKALPFAESEPGATGLELLLSLALKWGQDAAPACACALAVLTSRARGVLGTARWARCRPVWASWWWAAWRTCASSTRRRPGPCSLTALRSQGKHTPLNRIHAIWKFVRVVAHVMVGFITIVTRFSGLSQEQRELRVQAWSLGMLKCLGIKLVVRGKPAPCGPMLLVANHISWLDIASLHAARFCRFVSKADVRHWPVIGVLASGVGTLFIERESRRDAMRVVHHMAASLRAGDVLAVFPEGTTSDGMNLLPFHANLFQAAIAAPGCSGAPLVVHTLGGIARQLRASHPRRGHYDHHGSGFTSAPWQVANWRALSLPNTRVRSTFWMHSRRAASVMPVWRWLEPAVRHAANSSALTSSAGDWRSTSRTQLA